MTKPYILFYSSLPDAFVAVSLFVSGTSTFESPYQPRAPSLSDKIGCEKW